MVAKTVKGWTGDLDIEKCANHSTCDTYFQEANSCDNRVNNTTALTINFLIPRSLGQDKSPSNLCKIFSLIVACHAYMIRNIFKLSR